MKPEELRAKSKDELKKELVDLKKEQLNLRFEQANGQLENTARMRQVRRDVARIKTVLSEAPTEAKAPAKKAPAKKTTTKKEEAAA